MAEGGHDYIFIPSQRKKDKLAYKGYSYVCDRRIEAKSYWKCDQPENIRCIKEVNKKKNLTNISYFLFSTIFRKVSMSVYELSHL